jgi:hypothetical protein
VRVDGGVFINYRSRWLTVTDPSGRRRIDAADDWVHRELAEAFHQLDVQVDGIVIGDAIVTTADTYDGQIHSDAARPCRWPDLNNETATVDLSPGTGQHQISVWLLCRDRPPCPSASKSVTFTR